MAGRGRGGKRVGRVTPVWGPRWKAAIAALGSGATVADIREYIIDTFPDTVTGNIINAAPGDPLVNFEIATPVNSDQTASLNGWEFALQHSFWDTGFGDRKSTRLNSSH